MYRIQRAVQPSRPRTATFAHPLPYASRSRCASPLVVLNVVSADSRTGTRKTYVRFCIKIADYRFPRRLSVRLERRDVCCILVVVLYSRQSRPIHIGSRRYPKRITRNVRSGI